MKIEQVIQSNTQLPITKKILLNIIYTQNYLEECFNNVLKGFCLSSEQYHVLEIISEQKGKPVNMSAIQHKMITKASNTTRLVDKLLLRGLVRREVCSENRRKIDVYITAGGLELLDKIKPNLVLLEEKFAENLSNDELENLHFLLKKYRSL